MKKNFFIQVLIYGVCLGIAVVLLTWAKYRFLVIDHAIEIYGMIIAAVFISVGVWVGLKLSGPKTIIQKETVIQTETVIREVPVLINAPVEEKIVVPVLLPDLGISQREAEVLQFLAKGMSNQEIAGELFVSQNTIKTHLSNLYFKLDVKRRTQAVDKARSLGIIE